VAEKYPVYLLNCLTLTVWNYWENNFAFLVFLQAT